MTIVGGNPGTQTAVTAGFGDRCLVARASRYCWKAKRCCYRPVEAWSCIAPSVIEHPQIRGRQFQRQRLPRTCTQIRIALHQDRHATAFNMQFHMIATVDRFADGRLYAVCRRHRINHADAFRMDRQRAGRAIAP